MIKWGYYLALVSTTPWNLLLIKFLEHSYVWEASGKSSLPFVTPLPHPAILSATLFIFGVGEEMLAAELIMRTFFTKSKILESQPFSI